MEENRDYWGIQGRIFDIQKYSIHDGPGIRTSIFVKGCPLKCKWCHNPELMESRNQIIYSLNRCIGCGECVKMCPQHIISRDDDKGLNIDRGKCSLCELCVDNCYSKALRMSAEPMTIEEVMHVILQDKEFYDKYTLAFSTADDTAFNVFNAMVKLLGAIIASTTLLSYIVLLSTLVIVAV